MNTTETYIYYDEASSDWKPASLEELAMLNNPDLPVCRINSAGEPGVQTTYAAVEKTRTTATQRPEKAKQEKRGINTETKKPLPTLPGKDDTEQLLRYTLNYIRCFITFFVFVSLFGACASQGKEGVVIGIVLGALATALMHAAAKRAAKKETKL